MKALITRKQFLKLTALSAGAVALFSSVGFLAGHRDVNRTGAIRVHPVSGKKYSPSFLRFCERAKFNSVEEAIRHIKNQGVEYNLIKV